MNVPVWPTRPPWARESRFGYVDLRDRLDTRPRGLDRLDHPRMRGLDRFALRPGPTGDRARRDHCARVRRTRPPGCLVSTGSTTRPWSRQARPPGVVRARPPVVVRARPPG